jgi:hypothetical protein
MDNESLLTEFIYCITDEQRARPWNNELAERTEAARQVVLQRMSAASSSTAEEVRRLREALERIATAAKAALDHRYQMGAPMLSEHNELASAVTANEVLQTRMR